MYGSMSIDVDKNDRQALLEFRHYGTRTQQHTPIIDLFHGSTPACTSGRVRALDGMNSKGSHVGLLCELLRQRWWQRPIAATADRHRLRLFEVRVLAGSV